MSCVQLSSHLRLVVVPTVTPHTGVSSDGIDGRI